MVEELSADMRAKRIIESLGDAEERVKSAARAEVLAACIADVRLAADCAEKANGSPDQKAVAEAICHAIELRLRELQPAADLEAHDDYVRKLRDMDWIREFPVVNQHWCPGFPEGVKPYLEELLREECRPLLDVLRDAPPPANISSPHGQILELDNAMFHKAYFDWNKRRINELEKARAEGKG